MSLFRESSLLGVITSHYYYSVTCPKQGLEMETVVLLSG